MLELAFSIPLSGTVRIDGGTITVVVNRAETIVRFEPSTVKERRTMLPKGQSVFDVLLETARQYVGTTGENHFTAAQLYHEAVRRYPDLKAGTWRSHMIASAASHPSQRHYLRKRDFFRFQGNGAYELKPEYLVATAIEGRAE